MPLPPSQPHGEDIPQFPDVHAKLQKPTRQSAFDKQRAEAEAKRQREAHETAAVYRDFVRSFQDDDDNDDRQEQNDEGRDRNRHSRRPALAPSRNSPLPPAQPIIHRIGPSRRHFRTANADSTSVTAPSQGLPRPKPNEPVLRPISKAFMGSDEEDEDVDGCRDQRLHQYQESYEHHNGRGGNIYKMRGRSDRDSTASSTSIRAQEKAISKPTLRLSNLPPGTSVSQVKALISPLLSVDDVRILPQHRSSAGERRSSVAIVTLSQDSPATEIDSAVSRLQHRYLGYGYYMSLHRHLSSAVASSLTPQPHLGYSPAASDAAGGSRSGGSGSSGPFGARPTVPAKGIRHHSQRGRFAPPSSYSLPSGPAAGRDQILHVPVQPPRDINQMRLIHHVLETVLEHGPEVEALLMSRPEVQREEKWGWLWDARSEGGIWYRWRLWEIVTGFDTAATRANYLPVFEDSHAWKVPSMSLPFQHATSVDELCSDQDYNSDEDGDMDGDGPDTETDMYFLNPLGRARLAHLLSRLPTNMSRLRKGDMARITAFAIRNASHAAEEIVDIVIWNVEKPFALTVSNKNLGAKNSIVLKGTGEAPVVPDRATATGATAGVDDVGSACLVGLYVVNDILSSSSTSGVRHAWRYRQLFENLLKRRKVFGMLGTMPDRLNWGRLRIEKWRRSVGLVLNLWEGWCVFPADTHELFVQSFGQPASVKREQDAPEDGLRKSKWKVVETAAGGGRDSCGYSVTSVAEQGELKTTPRGSLMDQNGSSLTSNAGGGDNKGAMEMAGSEELSDVDGRPMSDGEDMDGESMSDGNIDGEPMDGPDDGNVSVETAPSLGGHDSRRPRKRMRAADMFAASEGSDSS